MKELLFLVADLWMIYAGFRYGWRFIRDYHNHLLGLEWMIIATSGSNFLAWSLFSGDTHNPMYDIAYFFDAFSRSVGVTLIAILGLMRVTHRYKASVPVEVGSFALAIVAGLYLQHFHDGLHIGPATYYLVVNLITSAFFLYFAGRVAATGARPIALATVVVTLAGTAIAVMYDFLPFPDDQYRTVFYILALATWGSQLFVNFRAYRALHEHNVARGLEPVATVHPVHA